MQDMVRRQKAAQAAVDRFKGRPFSYGSNDCARMAALVVRRMGRRAPIPKAGSYTSAIGAMRELKKTGHASIMAVLDAAGFERIAPAAALPADIILLEDDSAFGGALTIAVGNGRVLGYHEHCVGAEILQPTEYLAAWRV